jgi:hypothetical protein
VAPRNFFFISKTNLLKGTRGATQAHRKNIRKATKVHMKNIRKNTQQHQDQGKRAQKSTKLETLRRALTNICSKRDLSKPIFRSELVFSQSSKLRAFLFL